MLSDHALCHWATPSTFSLLLATLGKSGSKSTGRRTDSLTQRMGPTTHRAVQDPVSVPVVQLEGDCEVLEEPSQFMRERAKEFIPRPGT